LDLHLSVPLYPIFLMKLCVPKFSTCIYNCYIFSMDCFIYLCNELLYIFWLSLAWILLVRYKYRYSCLILASIWLI
jgi:hypothetical protein